MVPGFHGIDLVVILVIALLIFGPKKLPEMGSAIGKSIKEFKKGMNELTGGNKEEETRSSSMSLDTIERELASKRAAAAANETSTAYTASESQATPSAPAKETTVD